MGSAGHQDTIYVTYDGVRICAARRNLPWFVGNQLFLLILQEGRDLPRKIAPDIMIYPALALTNDPGSIAVSLHGPPRLVIEIASPTHPVGGCPAAVDHDINLLDRDAKPQLYEQIGVDEYLLCDPSGETLGERVWARRRSPGGFAVWLPEADGRWHSALGISFAPQGMLLRVYDHDGRLVPLSVEFDAMLAERERRLAELEAELRRLRGE